jgi:hypothetical protein
MQDATFEALGQYQSVIAAVSLRPIHIVDAPHATQSTPYIVQAIALRTTQQVYYSAPSYSFKANMLYPTRNPILGQYGAATGQAPTTGIYTGIPSGCGPNGVSGSPYS